MAMGGLEPQSDSPQPQQADDPYHGASRKLEELFVYWLSQKETAEMVEHCVGAVHQGQTLSCESGLEVSSCG